MAGGAAELGRPLARVNIASMALTEKTSKARTFRGVPPEVRKQERRAKLLEAALNLYGTRNYHSVTVREVCGEARLTERYFYESFENLEQLFRVLFSQVHEQLKRATLDVLMRAPREPMALAESSVRAWFGFVAEDPRRYRILLMDALSLHPSLAEHARAANEEYVRLVRSVILSLFPDGEQAHGLNGFYVSEALVGMNLALAKRWAQEELRTPFEELVRAAMAFYRGLWALDRELRASDATLIG